jgi:hypothetical protein
MSRHTARDRSLKGGRGRPSAHDGPRSRDGVRFDAEPIVHGASTLLFAPKTTLRRLDGDVTQEELDLLELATGQVTQPRARATKVVRGQLLDAGVRSRHADDVPEHVWRHPVTPDPAGLVDGAEHAALRDCGGRRPRVDRGFDPLRDGHGSDMTALADQIGVDSVPFSLLDRLQSERQQLASA